MFTSKTHSTPSDYLAAELFVAGNRRVSSSMMRHGSSRSSSPSSNISLSINGSATYSETQTTSSSTSPPPLPGSTSSQSHKALPTRQDSQNSCKGTTCINCKLTDEESKRFKAEKRKQQNRASQRRFRAKKENEIRGAADQVATLESLIQDLQAHNIELGQTNIALMARLSELENEQVLSSGLGNEARQSTTRCAQCRQGLIGIVPETNNFFWPTETIDPAHDPQLGTCLPLFDQNMLHYPG